MRKTGDTRPKAMPELVSEVYEHEGYMVPYMWAAILIYPFWPSMISHIALYRDDFLKALPPDAKVLELASGHGVMGLLAAETRPDIQVKASISARPRWLCQTGCAVSPGMIAA